MTVYLPVFAWLTARKGHARNIALILETTDYSRMILPPKMPAAISSHFFCKRTSQAVERRSADWQEDTKDDIVATTPPYQVWLQDRGRTIGMQDMKPDLARNCCLRLMLEAQRTEAEFVRTSCPICCDEVWIESCAAAEVSQVPTSLFEFACDRPVIGCRFYHAYAVPPDLFALL